MTPDPHQSADAPAPKLAPLAPAPPPSDRSSLFDSTAACFALPLLLFVLLGGASVWLWRGVVEKQSSAVESALDLVGSVAAERFLNVVQVETRPLIRLTREMASGRLDPPGEFVKAAESVQEVVRSMRTVVWVDVRGRVRAVSSLDKETLEVGSSVRRLPGWGDAFNESYQGVRRSSIVTGTWQGKPAQWLCTPYLAGEGATDRLGGRPRGALLTRLSLDEAASQAFSQGSWQYFNVLVTDATGQAVFASGGWNNTGGAAATVPIAERTEAVEIFNSEWTVHLRPTPQYLAQRNTIARTFMLVGGLGISLLVSGVVAQGLLHRRRDRRRTAADLAALEALAHISSHISDTPQERTDLLAKLADVAARLMNMSMASVTLHDPKDNSMRVVYRRALPNPAGRDVYDISETPCSAECMRLGRPSLYNDTAAPGAPFNPDLISRFGVRALMLLPLIVGGKAVGVLLLADGKPRRFSRRAQRLAELWMAEASAILSNRKLYEGMNAALHSLQRILDQRERMYEVFTRIQSAGTLREALDLIVKFAPPALEVDVCLICLPHGETNAFQVAAVTPGQLELEQRQQLLVECSVCLGVLQSGQVQQLGPEEACPVRGLIAPGTILFVPLRGGGRTIGLLALLRRRQSKAFDIEEIRAAELFAARAATAVENAQLHEQTLRQAESNAMLLRELNHRVGNNFASIIGLLKVAASELAPESRQGLERAVKRVHMMSRAHELFSGGADSVPMRDLVQTTLASLSADDGRVQFRAELEDPQLRLHSTRAVTLAMVLHELAFNALEHALGGNRNGDGGGELIVRVRRVWGDERPGRIAIDVIDRPVHPIAAGTRMNGSDNGSQSGNGSGHAAHHGIGLQLVRNLVARELGGSFSLSHDSSGTTATIEITLEQETECHP